MASSRDGEPLSPKARVFAAPSFNCYMIFSMGCKTSIDPQVIKEGLCQTVVLKHPRFTRLLAVTATLQRLALHTTMTFSNIPGPVEEISFYGHPIAYIAPSIYGHPHALTMHFESYANQMTMCLSVDPAVIPDPYLLCDDLEESLKLICDAVKTRHVVDVI